MADVVNLNERRPHWAGLCSCINCKHEWTGVAPTMATVLECPSCHTMDGVMFSAREVRLIRALEKIATGHAPRETSATNWEVAKGIASETLKNEGWGNS